MRGYAAVQSISVKVRDLDSAGMEIDSANEARFDGLNFIAEENADVMRELRGNPYRDAFTQAKHFAEPAGLKVVGATSVSTCFVGVPSVTQLAEGGLVQLDTAISPGQVDVSSSLQVTFPTLREEISATP